MKKIKFFTIIIILNIFLCNSTHAEYNENDLSKVYKQNIDKIQKQLNEIEEYIDKNGIKSVYDKYPKMLRKYIGRSTNTERADIIESESKLFYAYDWKGTIGKFDIIECGKISENYKYIKCMFYYKTYDSIDKKISLLKNDNFKKNNNVSIEEMYIVCDKLFENIINTYDQIKIFNYVNDMKKFNNATKIKLYYANKNETGYRAFLHSINSLKLWDYIRDLNTNEINILLGELNEIKEEALMDLIYIENYFLKKDLSKPKPIQLTNTRGINTGFPHEPLNELVYPADIKLIMEYDKAEYEIYLNMRPRFREIYFKKYDFFTYFNINNQLIFNLMIDYGIKYNKLSYIFYPLGDYFLFENYPEKLYQTIPKESQEIVCHSKIKYIFSKKLDQPDLLTYKENSIKFKTDNFSENIKKIDDIFKQYYDFIFKNINDSINFYYTPTCPLSHKIKYQYKIDTSGIELICPTHGTKKVKFD